MNLATTLINYDVKTRPCKRENVAQNKGQNSTTLPSRVSEKKSNEALIYKNRQRRQRYRQRYRQLQHQSCQIHCNNDADYSAQ